MLAVSQNQCLIRLKNSSLYKLIINNVFLIAFNIVIFLITINYKYCLVILSLFLYFIYKKNKKLFFLMIMVNTLIFISFIIHFILIKDKSLNSFNGIVININHYENYNKLTLKKGIYKVLIYDYDFLDIKIGDYISVSGINKEITQNRIEGLFNYKKYYFSQNIISLIKANNITIKNDFNIYYLRRTIYNYINNTFDEVSSSYMLGMVLGDSTTIETKSLESIRINSISHLFAISGLHISLLVKLLSNLLKKMKLDDKINENIICVVLSIYLVITNFAVSILRASLMYGLKVINDRLELKLTSLDIVSIIFISFVLINPYYMYYLSFVLSFSASFCIILLSQTFKEYNVKLNGFTELFIITLILQIATFPIVCNLNNNFNLLSVITNVIFITLVTSIVLPFTFLVLFLPFLKIIYQYLIFSFNYLNDFCAKHLILNINFPSFSFFEIIIFYILILLIITLWLKINKQKKFLLVSLLCIFIVLVHQKINLNINGNIYFLDIYEGDCTIIDLPLKKGVIVIDTGTSECSEVISFLKSKGIKKIDYLILTHKHDDHCGNAYNIINNFNVNKIVTSAYNDIVYPNNLKVKANSSFNLNGYLFYVLEPSKKSNTEENDNSIILYCKLGNYKYLFLGDATKEKEEELIKYNLDVDCVKVGHHGSKTSTSLDFYQSINPKYVFIETGRVLKYGFPHDEAIEILNNYTIYRTDLNYSIKVKFNNKRSIIYTLR